MRLSNNGMEEKKKKVGKNSKGQFTQGNTYGEGAKKDKYKAEYTNQLIEYFSTPPTRVEYIKHYDKQGNLTEEEPVVLGSDYPTFEAFAIKIGVTARTLENWAAKYPTTFGRAYERAKDVQKNMIIVNALGGRYNGNFAKFVASSQFDMAEKEKHEISGIEGIDLNIEILHASDGDKVR